MPLKLRTVEILGQRVQFATESLSRHRDSVIAYHWIYDRCRLHILSLVIDYDCRHMEKEILGISHRIDM
jgi:hypothetical protein